MFQLPTVCSPHYYGRDSNTPCGHCNGDDVCNSVTGHCPNGCKPHWTGTRCEGKYLLDVHKPFFSIKTILKCIEVNINISINSIMAKMFC